MQTPITAAPHKMQRSHGRFSFTKLPLSFSLALSDVFVSASSLFFSFVADLSPSSAEASCASSSGTYSSPSKLQPSFSFFSSVFLLSEAVFFAAEFVAEALEPEALFFFSEVFAVLFAAELRPEEVVAECEPELFTAEEEPEEDALVLFPELDDVLSGFEVLSFASDLSLPFLFHHLLHRQLPSNLTYHKGLSFHQGNADKQPETTFPVPLQAHPPHRQLHLHYFRHPVLHA